MTSPRLTVIVPSHDTSALTLACCEAVLAAVAADAELIVVDDASRDGTAQAIERHCPGVRVVRRDRNGGFSAAVNSGLAVARGEILLLVNSDATVDGRAVAALLAAFDADPRLGVAGAQLIEADGTPQWSGGREPTLAWMAAVVSGAGPVLGRARRRPAASADRDVDWVSGAAMAFRRAVLEAVGGFDERVRGYGQDLAFCLRARDAGWRVRIVGAARVRHAMGATLAPGSRLRHDPAKLWPDLLDWGTRRHGPAWAAVAGPALRGLAWSRIAVRRLIPRADDDVTRRLVAGARQLRWGHDVPEGGAAGAVEPVARASARAVPYLVTRQVVAQGLTIATGVLLSRWLSPAEFGAFAVIVLLHAVVSAGVGPGLAMGLVREAREPDAEAERGAFTLALVVAAVVAALLWAGAGAFARVFETGPDGASAMWMLGAAALVAAWQAVPVALLERRLDYRGVAIVEVTQACVFHAVTIALVLGGHGVAGLGVALVARAVAGVLLASLRCRWRPGLAWRGPTARRVRRFGVPFQSATVVNLAKDASTPLLVGLLAGPAAVGQVAWAQMLAGFPAMAAGILQRLLLPAFARVQDRPAALGLMVEGALTALQLVAAPLAVFSLVLIDPLVDVVFGAQWRPAVPVFALLWVANLPAAIVPAMLALLAARNRAGVVLGASVAWALGTWVIGAPLVWWAGAIGFGLTMLALQGVTIWLIVAARRHAEFSLLRSVLPAWGVAATAGAVVAVGRLFAPAEGILALVAWGLAGAVLHLALLAVVGARRLGLARPDWERA